MGPFAHTSPLKSQNTGRGSLSGNNQGSLSGICNYEINIQSQIHRAVRYVSTASCSGCRRLRGSHGVSHRRRQNLYTLVSQRYANSSKTVWKWIICQCLIMNLGRCTIVTCAVFFLTLHTLVKQGCWLYGRPLLNFLGVSRGTRKKTDRHFFPYLGQTTSLTTNMQIKVHNVVLYQHTLVVHTVAFYRLVVAQDNFACSLSTLFWWCTMQSFQSSCYWTILFID